VSDQLINSSSVVLAVFPAGEDTAALRGILADSAWSLHATATIAEACLLLDPSIAAVICECSFPDGHGWKDLLAALHDLLNPPALIVADRLADDRLWAEVLNLGAHDLLAKPFDTKEVLYAVSAACRWREGRERALAARRLSKPVGRCAPPAPETQSACRAASGSGGDCKW